ncbi:MAG: ilvB 1 [Dehalococcoidales bacterium]|nr:ilvB 1 [Dehalococcoidales bacterium]
MNAGEIVGQTLKLYDAEYLFGFSGGDHPFLLGILDAGIKYVLTHSERSAVAMADAYARATGKPSFAYAQWGPGAALAVSGVADAFWAQSPVVCITTSLSSASLYRNAYQSIDEQRALFEPLTKWNALVPNIQRLPDMMRQAIRMAVGGVPGPVHIDIPQELSRSASQTLEGVELYAESDFKKFPAQRVGPEACAIDRVIAVIRQAKRPLILAGGGVIASEAWDELIQLAEALSIPVVTSSAGKACMPTDHPLLVGGIGNYSRKVANDVIARSDVCIVVGSNLGDHTTKSRQALAPSAKIVHIDLDPGVLGNTYREEVSVLGDAKLTLKSIMDAAETEGLLKKVHPWADWVKEVQAMVKSWKAAFQEKAKDGGKPGSINPYFVIATLNRLISPDDVVVVDTGYMGAFGNALIDVKSPGRKYIRTPGSLGCGFPESLGVQCAVKNRGRVICLSGDGGIGYHVSDIETAVRCNLPVVVLILNNSTLAFTHHMFKLGYKRPAPQVTDYLDIDYGAVSRAFGAHGEKVMEAKDVEAALKRAFDSGRPAIVDIAVDKETYAPVIFYEPFERREV